MVNNRWNVGLGGEWWPYIDPLRTALAPAVTETDLRAAVIAALEPMERKGRNLAVTRNERLIGWASGVADLASEVRAALAGTSDTEEET